MAEHMGSNKNTAIAFLEMAANGKVTEAFERFINPSFRHHLPDVKGDATSLAAFMAKQHEEHPERLFEVKHALEDRDFVAVHSRVRLEPGGPDTSCLQLFRFVNIRIVEMWGVEQEAAARSINEHGLF
jgi:predicted SnoaL-like aldol condensation-catalyzing enzyme